MPSASDTASTPPKSRIVLVEDHPMFRERLAELIDRDLEMTVAGEAANIEDAIKIIESTKPDAVIVDISLRGSSGLELIKELKARGLDIPALVLSMHSEFLYAQRSLQAGARGYVSKDEDASQVMLAIRKILAGGIFLSAQMNERMLQRFAQTFEPLENRSITQLSDRELEIFKLFGQGLNTRLIAEKLSVGENTISTFRQRIKKKLDVKDFTELYCLAARWVREEEQKQ